MWHVFLKTINSQFLMNFNDLYLEDTRWRQFTCILVFVYLVVRL